MFDVIAGFVAQSGNKTDRKMFRGDGSCSSLQNGIAALGTNCNSPAEVPAKDVDTMIADT